MAGVVHYPDLRYLFMRGLIDHERDQRCRHYLKSAAECTSRAIVSLELADEPIRSVRQARMLEGIGGETCTRLKNLEKERAFSCVKPLGARFVSSAGGILVGLLDAIEEKIYNGSSPEKNVLVAEDSVKQRAIRLTEESFSEGPNEFCKAWWRLEVLIKRGYIRRHSYKKSPVLHLLPLGKDVAVRLRTQIGLISTVPIKPSSCVSPSTKVSANILPSLNPALADSNKVDTRPNQGALLLDALYTNDRGYDGLVMLIDRRELGGEQFGLAELLGLLNDIGIVYKTQHLKAGDYSWLWRVSGREVVLPCLVERKRADDIARTLKEGRFWSQVNKMKDWKEKFTRQGIECGIHYVIERKPEEYVVKCGDGCQGIIQCGNPTLTQVKMVIEDLKGHPDLLVKETNSLNNTVKLLASMTTELGERISNGDFDQLLQIELTEADNNRYKPTEMEANTKCKQFSNINGDLQLIEHHSSDNNRLAVEKPELAIAKSKKDVTVLTNFTKSEHRNSDATVLEHLPYGEFDEEAELALVLERSKHETHIMNVPFKDNIGWQQKSSPLMQHHCSAGGSLQYPKQFIPPGSQDKPLYQPKISQHGKVHGHLRSLYPNNDSRKKKMKESLIQDL